VTFGLADAGERAVLASAENPVIAPELLLSSYRNHHAHQDVAPVRRFRRPEGIIRDSGRSRGSMDQPETRFAWNGDVALAYQVVGSGEHDLLYLPGLMSNVDVMWEWPPYERFLRRLTSFARLILMDRRGYGCSERYGPDAVAPLEVLVDDAVVVLEAAEASKAAIFAFEDATLLAVLWRPPGPNGCRIW
jgi:hypothetical protein